MLKNAIWKESMEEIYCKDRNEHGEIDLKQSINLLTNCNTRNPMEKENLCFCGSKRVLASVHGPKGRKGGQGSVDGLFVSFSITIQPTIEN
jgi:hypothetical protein